MISLADSFRSTGADNNSAQVHEQAHSNLIHENALQSNGDTTDDDVMIIEEDVVEASVEAAPQALLSSPAPPRIQQLDVANLEGAQRAHLPSLTTEDTTNNEDRDMDFSVEWSVGQERPLELPIEEESSVQLFVSAVASPEETPVKEEAPTEENGDLVVAFGTEDQNIREETPAKSSDDSRSEEDDDLPDLSKILGFDRWVVLCKPPSRVVNGLTFVSLASFQCHFSL